MAARKLSAMFTPSQSVPDFGRRLCVYFRSRCSPVELYFVALDFGEVDMPPNTSLEPTPVTPVSLRCGFRVGGSRWRRGSVLGR